MARNWDKVNAILPPSGGISARQAIAEMQSRTAENVKILAQEAELLRVELPRVRVTGTAFHSLFAALKGATHE